MNYTTKKPTLPESVERNPENDINTTRIIALVPTKNGYKTLIIKKTLNDGKYRYEIVGGKIDEMCPNLKGAKNDKFNNGLFTQSSSGRRVYSTEATGTSKDERDPSSNVMRESACQEFLEEAGIKILPENLMHLAYTERATIGHDKKPNGGKHCINTYVTVISPLEPLVLANDEEDKIENGALVEAIQFSSTIPKDNIVIRECNKQKGIIKEILEETHIVDAPFGNDSNTTSPIVQVVEHHFPKDPVKQQTILNRLKIMVNTRIFKEKEREVLEKSSSLESIVSTQMKQKKADNNNKVIVCPNQTTHITAPNGLETTQIDYLSEFNNLEEEQKKFFLSSLFKNNAASFFTIQKFKDSLISLCKEKIFFGMTPEMTNNITNIITSITTYDNFESAMLNEDHQKFVPLILSILIPLKHFFNNGITPKTVEEANVTLSGFEENINNLEQVDATKTREKSWERACLKMLHKGSDTYIPGDFAGMRVICKKGQQKEVAEKIKEMIENNNNDNINVKGIEDSAKKQKGKRANNRYGEYKVEGEINGVGFEIQINDADGYAQSEANEKAHFVFEYVRILAVQSRLMNILPQDITKESIEEWVRSLFSINYEYLNGQDLTQAVEESMRLFQHYGFFMTDNSQKNIFVDYLQLFTNKYRTSEHMNEILKHFSNQLDEKLQCFDSSLSLNSEEWSQIFHDPLSFFRAHKKKKEEGAKTKELYKAIVSVFFFHISGESEHFHILLKKWDKQSYDKIEKDSKSYKDAQQQLQQLTAMIERKNRNNEDFSKEAKNKEGTIKHIKTLRDKYHLP